MNCKSCISLLLRTFIEFGSVKLYHVLTYCKPCILTISSSVRCVSEGGPAHAKRFTYSVKIHTTEKGWTDECVGEPMPSVKKAKDSAAQLLLQIIKRY